MNDLLNIELFSDSLEEFDEACGKYPSCAGRDSEDDLWKACHLGPLEKSTSLQHASALYHSEQIHSNEAKSHLKLKAMVTDVLTGQQPKFFIAQI